MTLTKEQITNKVTDYLHFNGIELSSEQKESIQNNLSRYANDEDQLEQEMICDIRTLIGD